MRVRQLLLVAALVATSATIALITEASSLILTPSFSALITLISALVPPKPARRSKCAMSAGCGTSKPPVVASRFACWVFDARSGQP